MKSIRLSSHFVDHVSIIRTSFQKTIRLAPGFLLVKFVAKVVRLPDLAAKVFLLPMFGFPFRV